MFRWLANLIRGLTHRSPSSLLRPGHRFRLRVEGLEGRDCPSIWMDGTGDHQAGNPDNWNDGVLPGNGNPADFTGTDYGGSDDDCWGLSGSFDEIDLDLYPGTVTATGPVTTQLLYMGSGTISQQPGADLTIRLLTWYGGTLTSATSLANVAVDGSLGPASATIDPYGMYGTGTVTLGSNLNFTNGATGTIYAGTLAVTNNIVINIGANCGVDVEPGQPDTLTIQQNVGGIGTGAAPGRTAPTDTFTIQQNVGGIKPMITIRPNGYFRLLSGTAPLASGVYNHGGEFTLMAGTTMNLTSDIGEWVPAGWSSWGWSYGQDNGGITQLYNGSTLQVSLPAAISGGMLATMSDGNGGGSSATIVGNLTVSGGDIYIDAGDVYHDYGTLKVNGDVTWSGGTYHPFVDGDTDQGPSDLWWATGSFSIAGTAALAPAALNGEGYPIMPVPGFHWTILEADGYFTASTQPTYNNAIWFLTPDDLPIQFWDLNAV